MEFLTPPFIIAILIALSVHEWAHGFIAYKLGDPTAKYEGRLTLNPIAHLDPIGTLMFIIVGFGWGKPVPINPTYFKHFKRDTALTAIAGPISNLILSFVAFFLMVFIFPEGLRFSAESLIPSGGGSAVRSFVIEVLQSSLFLNLGLMAFNLLPVAPLDGSKILQAFIPLQLEDQYDRFMQMGPYILLFLIIADRAFNAPILLGWVYGIINVILGIMGAIARVIM